MTKVSERLPPAQARVLALTEEGEYLVVVYLPEAGDEGKAKQHGHLRGITHWCDLPVPEEPDAVRMR